MWLQCVKVADSNAEWESGQNHTLKVRRLLMPSDITTVCQDSKGFHPRKQQTLAATHQACISDARTIVREFSIGTCIHVLMPACNTAACQAVAASPPTSSKHYTHIRLMQAVFCG